MPDKVNILIVDDLPEKILVLEMVLAELGENIVTAGSGPEALQHVLRQEFAVILLDVMMPGMDGLETATLIRQRKKSAHIPIIFVTGVADDLRSSQGYSLGAVDYILSPVHPHILRSKVKVFVDLHRMTREVRRAADERVALAREQAAREAAEQSAAALRASEERFRLASEAVTGFIYEVDTATGLGTASPGLTELLGFPADAVNDVAWWAGRLHPDDLPRALRFLAEVERDGRDKYRYEYRIRHRDGHYVHVWDQGVIVRDAAGRPTRRVGNVVDVSEQKAAQAALAEANRRKDEFLSMLAHELRNPLAPICNAIQILRLREPSEPHVRAARDMIDRNVGQMIRLVDDLLDVSRITQGKIRLLKEAVDLVAVVRQAVEVSTPLVTARKHRLHVDLPAEPVSVCGDEIRLTQVVANLLNNAAKYTDPGGDLRVVVARDGGDAVVRVRDSGIGIPPHMLAGVFDLFTQVDESLDRAQGGLGIGLTLVRRLVEMHGGAVKAESEGPGRGSEFIVRLPALADRCGPAPEANGRHLAAGPARRRVLIVDDNRDAADSLAALVGLAGHDVRVVHDGPAALTVAEAFRPEVVLLDIGLPGMSGYEVARRLRGLPPTAGAVLAALTGYGQDEDRRQSREAGIDHHLVKPPDPDALRRLLSAPDPSPVARPVVAT